MQIIWYGHSCFLIKTSIGKRILMDPLNTSQGYDNNFPKCDVITISHSRFDNSYLTHSNTVTKVIYETGKIDLDFLEKYRS